MLPQAPRNTVVVHLIDNNITMTLLKLFLAVASLPPYVLSQNTLNQLFFQQIVKINQKRSVRISNGTPQIMARDHVLALTVVAILCDYVIKHDTILALLPNANEIGVKATRTVAFVVH